MEICTVSYSNELKFIIAFDCLYFCCLLKLWVLITSALHVRLFPLGEHERSSEMNSFFCYTVALVESEKTSIICAAHIDLADWLIEFLEGKNNAK